jgi:hypothetical protein
MELTAKAKFCRLTREKKYLTIESQDRENLIINLRRELRGLEKLDSEVED